MKNYKKNRNDLFSILLNDDNVNHYTKLLIILNRLDYYQEYYIPNKKLMKMLGIHKKNVIQILNKLEDNNVIKLHYKKSKRYFDFVNIQNKVKFKEDIQNINLYDYNWLEEEE